jgi:IS605 OrfB family transposase
MKARKTIRAKIVGLTRRKATLVASEYENFQRALQEKPAQLYSATRQQAERFRRRIQRKRNSNLKPREYPMILRRDTIKIDRQPTKLSPWWFRIPVSGVRGGIWVAIAVAPPHQPLLELSLRETKLIRRGGEWYLLITVEKEVELSMPKSPTVILAIDLGEKYVATSVAVGNCPCLPKFYGCEIRGIRRHFRWLRARLGRKKKLKKIKQLANVERRKVRDRLHKISRKIVNEAIQLRKDGHEVVIAVGNVRGHRKGNKGRKFNRIRAQMPSHALKFLISYKAAWEGIPVALVDERNTSRICHRCGLPGRRPIQALFVCPYCDIQYNADLNGAINIAHRLSCYMRESGAEIDTARNLAEVEPRIPGL